MKTKIRSTAMFLTMGLCVSYLAGCAGGDTWVKQSEMTQNPVSTQQEAMITEVEKIPAKSIQEGSIPE